MNHNHHDQRIKAIIRAILMIALSAALLLAATLVPRPARADWHSLSGGFLPAHANEPHFLLSPDSRTVAFVVDKDTDDVLELYAVPMTGTLPIKLNPPLAAGGAVAKHIPGPWPSV